MYPKACNKYSIPISLTALITIYVAILILPLPAFSATYYVNVNGHDSNPGTLEQPWRTIQKAADFVQAGDTVIVQSGTYDERVLLPSGKSGTPGAKITFKADPRRSVYMKGFRGDRNNWLVEKNEVERLVYYSEDADYSRFFGENHIIRNNLFHGTKSEEIGSSHVDGFQTFDNNANFARNIIIEGNRVLGFYHEGMTIGNATEGAIANITVRNNIFANSSSWGICSYGVSGLKVYNNVFAYIDSSAIGLRAYANGPITTAEIKNNIFYVFGAPYWTEGGSTVDARNNILYKGSGSLDPVRYPNDICNQEPKFVDAARLDFRLQSGSPAIDAGVPLAAFSYDIVGTPRPQGNAWDIGAYEFNGQRPNSPRNLRIIGR